MLRSAAMALSRRALLRSVAALPLAAWRPAPQDAGPRIDGQALRERITTLSGFGRPAGGTFAAPATSRVTREWNLTSAERRQER